MGSPQGRPKDPAKREAILEAAHRLFLAGGFDGASMDRIARDAGVSKATLYSHFADKEALLFACIVGEVERSRAQMEQPGTSKQTLEERLVAFGRGLLGLLSRPDIHQFGRLLMAQSARHPHLARLFYDAGPQRVCDALTVILEEATRAGELACADPRLAADQLVCMWKGMHHMRQELGLSGPRSASEIDRHVRLCTALFLRGHGR